MVLDFWSLGTIIFSFFEFCFLCASEGSLISVTSVLGTVVFLLLCYIGWKSTDTPSDIPLPPAPPFVISIQTTTGAVQRHTLQDIRLFSTQPYFSRILSESQARRERNVGSTEQSQGNTTETTGAPVSPSSFVFHRLWFRSRQGTVGPSRSFRSFLRTRFHSPLLFHRLFPRHRAPDNGHDRGHDREGAGQSNSNERRSPNSSTSTRPFVYVRESATGDSDTSLRTEARPLELNQAQRNQFHGESEIPLQNNVVDSVASKEDMDAPPPEGQSIKFTIKFLNDTQLEVETSENEKVGSFKRRHFSRELSENKAVRLIFNGRVMDDDNRTLKESGIFEQCVVHCLIVAPQPQQQNPTANVQQPASGQGAYAVYGPPTNTGQNNSRGPEPGMFFVTLMGVILIFLWFVCFNFGQQLFTQSAVVSLSVLTGIFLIGLVAFYLPVHPTVN